MNMKDKEVPVTNHGSIEDKQIVDIPVPKPRKKSPIPKPRKLQKGLNIFAYYIKAYQ